MKIDSVLIYGFGKSADCTYTLTPGLNCLSDDGSGKAAELTAFIVAAFCGFAEDNASAASVLPSRAASLPADNIPFGGELKFSDASGKYMISAKWGEACGDDMVTLVRPGGGSEVLAPGETIAGRLWGLTRDSAAKLLSIPSDGRDVSDMLKTLISLPERSVWFEPVQAVNATADANAAAGGVKPADNGSFPAENLRRAALRLRNDSKTGIADMAEAHLADLKKELELVDELEERTSTLQNSVREAEKEKNELSRKAGSDMSTEQIRRFSDQCSDFQRAAAIRNDAAELQEEIIDEEKYVRRGQRPWLVLLWLLAVLDVVVIVILTVYPVKIPWLGEILTKIAGIRFPALYVAAGLFLLLIILIAAVSGSGMRRLKLLKEDLEFRKRQLSELLTSKETELSQEAEKAGYFSTSDAQTSKYAPPSKDAAEPVYVSDSLKWLDQETRDMLTKWDTPHEAEFFEAADKVLTRFSKKAASAKSALSGASGANSEFSALRAKTAGAADKLSALEAELSAYEAQLNKHRSYTELSETCAELEKLISRCDEQLNALQLAGDALNNYGTAKGGYALSTLSPDKLARRADEILTDLTGGARSGVRISDEMVPYIDDNGSSRGLGSVSGLLANQILLSIRLAALSLALSENGTASPENAGGAIEFTKLILPGAALDRFDPVNASRVLSYISGILGSETDAQVIVRGNINENN